MNILVEKSKKNVLGALVGAGATLVIARTLSVKSVGLTVFLVAVGTITGMVVQDNLQKVKTKK